MIEIISNQPNPNRIIELPALEQIKKGFFSVTERGYRKKYSTNLEKYFCKGSISLEQYNAGCRLYADAYHGGVLNSFRAMDYTKAKESGNLKTGEMSWLAADKHKNFSNAINSPDLGRVQKNILWEICIWDFSLSDVAEEPKYAIGLLRESLNELVRHYRRQR